MTTQFKLSYQGLNYLTASPDINEDRAFLLGLLRNGNYASTSLSQLETVTRVEKATLVRQVHNALKHGWLISNDDPNISDNSSANLSISHNLYMLSSTGSALIADLNGFIIDSSGFTDIDSEYLSASATNLIRINELAKTRNPNLTSDAPWKTGIQWGKQVVMMQRIYLHTLHLSLVIGGKHQLNNIAYFNLLAGLVQRYRYDQ